MAMPSPRATSNRATTCRKRVADQRLLEPDQRIDAELHVIDPGKAAIGFEIDACLRGEGGDIGCANDSAAPRRRLSVHRVDAHRSLRAQLVNVVLAPMAGVTDRPFRQIARQLRRGSRGVGNDHQ